MEPKSKYNQYFLGAKKQHEGTCNTEHQELYENRGDLKINFIGFQTQTWFLFHGSD